MEYFATMKRSEVLTPDVPRANPETSFVHSLKAAVISLPFTRQWKLSVGQRRGPAPRLPAQWGICQQVNHNSSGLTLCVH